MIKNDIELEASLERIQKFLDLVINMRKVEENPSTYEASAGGFLAEIARMNLEVNEYLSLHPTRFEQEQQEKIAA
ncbi:MAG TPA: hypothetical protein VK400_03725 [Pyrinomonadaceae bacterium]|nr:hypothetical protein [Pyrinomonadaceae bacterium]